MASYRGVHENRAVTDPSNPLKILGRHVRKLRRERDLSQEDLAGAAEISRSNVSDLERGMKEPRFLTLFSVAKALDVPPSRLLEPFDPKS